MTTYTHLSVEHTFEDRIATVTLRRPEVHNAFNGQIVQDLITAFTELSKEEQLHGVVLTGEGPSFSAGADLNLMKESVTFTAEQNLNDALRLADLLEAINTFPCPVVARVNGTAMGGGVGLVAVCDIAIAVESARFAFSEVKLGIAPAVISPYVIRKIGETNARVLFVTGERFSANRARSIGLVHSVVPDDQLDDAVQKAVNELLSSAPQAIRVCKVLAMTAGQMAPDDARRYTAETIARLRIGDEAQERLQAFLERRKRP
ncbi:MAG TPA: enoyl-CoA hydratase-related protein [Ktedonosporobacter sp.]|jgi:methylglutaconyl-CoA hydratase|nr:enoyl-CoA hydratase-related protein [Ktedonosporobacter sp.]